MMVAVRWSREQLPCLTVLRPLPVSFPGRWTTSMDSMSWGSAFFASCRAHSDSRLNSSEPQNRILNGLNAFGPVELYRRWLKCNEERTAGGSLQNMASHVFIISPGSQSHPFASRTCLCCLARCCSRETDGRFGTSPGNRNLGTLQVGNCRRRLRGWGCPPARPWPFPH